jgi:hypothetical protein
VVATLLAAWLPANTSALVLRAVKRGALRRGAAMEREPWRGSLKREALQRGDLGHPEERSLKRGEGRGGLKRGPALRDLPSR